jgi:hypothetical protein
MIMMTRLAVAAAADPGEIQEGGEVHSRLLVGGKGGGLGRGQGREIIQTHHVNFLAAWYSRSTTCKIIK